MIVRTMETRDLNDVRHVMNLAFGTFVGAPEPERFFGDLDFAGPRLGAPNVAAFVAEDGNRIVGSNFATRWGSVAFFGPLSVHPDLWEQKLGQELMTPVIDTFGAWKPKLRVLFTFPNSPKHISLYYRYGYCPRFLTAVMTKRVTPKCDGRGWTAWSSIGDSARGRTLQKLREITEANFAGLDLTDEIALVVERKLGDTIIVGDVEAPDGFAVCHCGPNTEAGSGRCYLKFAATRPGDANAFERLLAATEAYASQQGLERVVAGMNMGREEAYRMLLERRYKTFMQGLTMHAPNAPTFSAPGHFVIDDWR